MTLVYITGEVWGWEFREGGGGARLDMLEEGEILRVLMENEVLREEICAECAGCSKYLESGEGAECGESAEGCEGCEYLESSESGESA